MKKKISIILALAIFCGVLAPLGMTRSMASENNVSKLEELKGDLKNVKGTPYDKVLNKVNSAINKLENDASVADGTSYRFNTETIYDLDSIGVRVELLAKCGQAIHFGTSELADKVVEAHNKLGGAITLAVIKALDPFASVDSIKAAVGKLDEVMKELRTYPVISDNDVATIYVKAALDKAIWNVRFERDKKVLGKVPFAIYNELNKNITKAVGVQLNPSVKVKDVKAEIVKVNDALKAALAHVK